MDNVKKFEDFLDRMQGLLDEAKRQGHIIVRVEDLEKAFPELTESEDERIKNDIRGLIWFALEDGSAIAPGRNTTKEEALAWLEKQESVGEIVERCKTSWYNEGKIQGQIEGLSDDEKYQQGWHDALEKQGEQVNCPQNLQVPNGGIVLEDFSGGEGHYKVNLDYLNKKQVEEIENIVNGWNKINERR